MNRRSFLGLLGVAPVALTAAPQIQRCAAHIGETIQVKKPMRYSMLRDPDILRAQHELNRIITLQYWDPIRVLNVNNIAFLSGDPRS